MTAGKAGAEAIAELERGRAKYLELLEKHIPSLDAEQRKIAVHAFEAGVQWGQLMAFQVKRGD